MNTELETKLERLFAAMEARKAAIRREREDRKLSRRRYWWQEPQTNELEKPITQHTHETHHHN